MYVTDSTYSNAMLYGETPVSIRDYIREKAETVSAYARERGNAFMSQVKDRWDEYNSDAVLRRMRAIRERTKGAYYTRDMVRELTSLSEIQQAPPVMRQFIMADPWIKERYENQRTEGYGDQYINPYPGVMGQGDYYYRRMDQGMVHLAEEESAGYHYTMYYEILKHDDRELFPVERVGLKRTVDRVKYYMSLGKEDPLSATGAYL